LILHFLQGLAPTRARNPAPSGNPRRGFARWRVPLGFVTAIVVLVLASPTWRSMWIGLSVALVGEAIRMWAAGHLEKSREVTRSGPYRWTRHPLYVGSSFVALGVIIAASSVTVAIVGTLYMVTTIVAAVRAEEAFLRQAFGDTYARYQRSEGEPMERRFSLERAMRNREYRAMMGIAGGFALRALKITVSE
jgi:protein-S-isoprenylcysteine O-methyltransferase Ste14